MDEWGQLRVRLSAAGVDGVEDLARFVSNPKFFGAWHWALPRLERVEREHAGTALGDQAARQVKRARKSLS